MTKSKRGSLTIYLALSMMSFLLFCLVLTEGTRVYFLRTKGVQAMELAEFSVLSEYQYELFENYGVFFVDLDYEQGRESTAALEQRARLYFLKNTEEVTAAELKAKNFQRATDQGGLPFFQQAVEFMKVKSGYKLLENIIGNAGGISAESVDLGKILEENAGEAERLLGDYVDEDGKPLFQIAIPRVSFPSVHALTEAVFGSESTLSDKSVNLRERISQRELSVGSGRNGKISLIDMQLFHAYLFEKIYYYGAKKTGGGKAALEYQMEYIICGEESDRKNLENMMWRIFLLRAGGNFLFYHQDAERLAQAEAEAAALAGITGNAVIIGLVREILLVSQAIEEGIQDTKRIFAGEKVPLYQNGGLAGVPMGYEQYLYLFLNGTGATQKIYRCMDIAELEVRRRSGYQGFRLDHCVDQFEIEWTWRFKSIFETFPLMDGGEYETTVKRKVCYAT